ncbi:MAG: hypothetical protein J5819_03195 [Eubacterium sp.]|nr:hypothetical protein [Eubacterium sp.]
MGSRIFDKKDAVFRGGPMQSFWYADEHYPYHLKAFAVLDSDVDPVHLKKAWDRTKQIYPVIDMAMQVFDEDIYFFDVSPEIGNTDESDAPVCPGGEATAGRAMALTFSGKTITLTAYHSLVDEFGIRQVLATLLRAYLCDFPGSFDPEFKPEDIFIQNTMLAPEDYKPQPLTLYGNSADIFYDDSIPYDMDEPMTASCIRVSRRAFMEIAGSCPEAVLSAITARTVYELYTNERRALSLDMLTDFRGAFGIRSSIAPCSKHLPMIVSYDEVMEGSFEEAVQRICSLRETQTSDDYLKSYLALDNTYAVLGQKRPAAAVAYMDVLSPALQRMASSSGMSDAQGSEAEKIGSGTARELMSESDVNAVETGLPIRQVAVSYLEKRSVLMIGYGESMWIYLQFGDRTEDYTNAMMRVLENVGIEATVITEARRVPVEITEA